jgi:hypothetical protein
MVAALRRYCRTRGIARGESGITLVLALAFITMLGVFIVALLGLTQANLKTTTVTRSRIDTQYTADAGADFALEQVRTSAITSCPPAIAASPASNGVTPAVSVTCSGGTTTTTGSTPLLGTYSAIALGSSGIPTSGTAANGDNLAIKFAGGIYSAGTVGAVPGTGNSVTVQGNAQLAAASCPYNATTDPAVTGTCTGSQAAPTVATSTKTVVIPTAPSLAPVNGTGANALCTLVYPGTYTGFAGFSDPDRGYYLASGTYYFNNNGDIPVNGWVKGGDVGTTTAALPGFSSRCPAAFANDANAKAQPGHAEAYTGSGVTFILGGNAALHFADDTDDRIELFPRVPAAGSPDLAATAGVSIWGRANSTTGVTVPASYTVMTAATPYYTIGKIADVVVHGLTYLPDHQLSISPLSNPDAGGVAQFKGGVIAKTLSVVLNNSLNVTPIIAGTLTSTTSIRTVVITSVATPTGGGAATTLKIVATYPATANAYPTIVSWRKV